MVWSNRVLKMVDKILKKTTLSPTRRWVGKHPAQRGCGARLHAPFQFGCHTAGPAYTYVHACCGPSSHALVWSHCKSHLHTWSLWLIYCCRSNLHELTVSPAYTPLPQFQSTRSRYGRSSAGLGTVAQLVAPSDIVTHRYGRSTCWRGPRLPVALLVALPDLLL